MNDSIDYASLGDRIRRLRQSRGITQDVLANRLGLSPSFLGHLERGSRKASLETLVALCNYLRISPDYLLADSLEASVFPSVSKLSPRQKTALNQIFHVIESTMIDWSDLVLADAGLLDRKAEILHLANEEALNNPPEEKPE